LPLYRKQVKKPEIVKKCNYLERNSVFKFFSQFLITDKADWFYRDSHSGKFDLRDNNDDFDIRMPHSPEKRWCC